MPITDSHEITSISQLNPDAQKTFYEIAVRIMLRIQKEREAQSQPENTVLVTV
ncbi:hypothetical protein [Alicyclobacillus fastidiosus]|uniref:Uncharacterized protein n=1 Tax=Alicyclobacillus fastidiosus TaxID=392011 RepID=A0ABV5AK91_9BACL|nr:hypothetical protein [Alicyclobacillus fastidiosus]WEH09309.1 hypothetical protein PYS47_21975 [Alicyclobacillus fastidiosus]